MAEIKSFLSSPLNHSHVEIIDLTSFGSVVNAAFLFFETSKLWVLFMYICILDGKPKD